MIEALEASDLDKDQDLRVIWALHMQIPVSQ